MCQAEKKSHLSFVTDRQHTVMRRCRFKDAISHMTGYSTKTSTYRLLLDDNRCDGGVTHSSRVHLAALRHGP
jgi:hypothetical protein